MDPHSTLFSAAHANDQDDMDRPTMEEEDHDAPARNEKEQQDQDALLEEEEDAGEITTDDEDEHLRATRNKSSSSNNTHYLLGQTQPYDDHDKDDDDHEEPSEPVEQQSLVSGDSTRFHDEPPSLPGEGTTEDPHQGKEENDKQDRFVDDHPDDDNKVEQVQGADEQDDDEEETDQFPTTTPTAGTTMRMDSDDTVSVVSHKSSARTQKEWQYRPHGERALYYPDQDNRTVRQFVNRNPLPQRQPGDLAGSLHRYTSRYSTRYLQTLRKLDFCRDDRQQDMTWGRRWALHFLEKPWYNPRARPTATTPDELLGLVACSSNSSMSAPDHPEQSLSPAPVRRSPNRPTQRPEQARLMHRGTHHSHGDDGASFSSISVSLASASVATGTPPRTTTTTTSPSSPRVVHHATTASTRSTRTTHSSTTKRPDTQATVATPPSDAHPFTKATQELPSLEKAWAYFEHVALARYIVSPSSSTKSTSCCNNKSAGLDRADANEDYLPTKLYSPWWCATPHAQLGDWGLGMGLYFSAVRAIGILMLLAGLLNWPNLQYYASSDYHNPSNTAQAEDAYEALRPVLQGSAICTDTTWVPCPDCTSTYFASDRLVTTATKVGGADGSVQTTTFALRNNCVAIDSVGETGVSNYLTLLLIVVGLYLVNKYLSAMEITFDEDEQTAQDYSIVVKNPPGNATDPKEWQDYFEQEAFFTHENHSSLDDQDDDGDEEQPQSDKGESRPTRRKARGHSRHRPRRPHVTACTIAVDNDLLVRCLVERREVLRRLEFLVDPGTALDSLTLARVAAKLERHRTVLQSLWAHLMWPGIPEYFARLVVLTAKIQGLAQQAYPATKIFVTLETEASQRAILSALTVGKHHVKRNNSAALPSSNSPQMNNPFLFRGKQVLHVKEPDEPNTIRWQDLNETTWNRIKQQGITTLVSLGLIILNAFVIGKVHDSSIVASAFLVALTNVLFPTLAKFMTSFEKHASEGSKQRSLYFKIAAFRFVNTAVHVSIITPFTKTLDEDGGTIPHVYALFFADIVTSNGIQLADFGGHFKRHFLAPRAKNQDAMNTCMQGAEFELAERYTNMTKLLLLALWYYTIYPAALFLCSVALLITYFTDKFSLMRTWKRAPHLGTKMAKFGRNYFFPLTVVVMAVLASYYWSGFPFDNLCAQDSTVDSQMVGTWLLQPTTNSNSDASSSSSDTIVRVQETDQAYRFCLQNFWEYDRDESRFPFIAEFQRDDGEWMTDDQETMTRLWGWTSIAVIVLVLLKIGHARIRALVHQFRGRYKPVGGNQNINFSEVPSTTLYTPQVQSSVFSYPLLAYKVKGIDPEKIGGTDPDRPLDYYDLTKDADVLLHGTDVSSKTVFSRVFHWPPPLDEDDDDDDDDDDDEWGKEEEDDRHAAGIGVTAIL